MIVDVIEVANANGDKIAATIMQEVGAVGYTLSDNLDDMLNNKGTEGLVTYYGDNFSNKLTSVNAVLQNIATSVANITTAGDNIAAETIATTTPTTQVDASAPTFKPTPAPTPTPEPEPEPEVDNTPKYVQVTNGQWWLYDGGPKIGRTDYIVHTGERYLWLGEENGYTKIMYNGRPHWFNSSGAYRLGFSQGGFVADAQRMAYSNGDDILTFNTLKRGEAVLNPAQTQMFSKFVTELPHANAIIDAKSMISPFEQNSLLSNANSSIDVGGVVFNLSGVQDVEDFKHKLRNDKEFERFIQSITTDRLFQTPSQGTRTSKYKYC